MFPAPETIATPGLSASTDELGVSAEHLLQKLQRGHDCEEEIMGYLVSGGRPDARFVFASLGNRLGGLKPCPKSLMVLLAMGADPSVRHPTVGPAIHWACRNGVVENVDRLLGAKADPETKDQDGVPPLNTAICSGAVDCALSLIRHGADVQWKHHDGATYLHVMVSWLCDGEAAGMNQRMLPVGNGPAELVSAFIRHGVDPTVKQKWQGKGLSAFETWRARKDESPWLEDDRTWRDFKPAAQSIHKTLTAASEAMEQKAKGNKLYGEKNLSAASEAWATSRRTLLAAGIEGQHVAVLWSNEAMCRRKMDDLDGSRTACEEGLKLDCTEQIRKKLEFSMAECSREPSSLPATDKPAETAKAGAEAPEPAQAQASEARKVATKTPIKKGFFDDAKADLYGPEGSKQGQMPQSYKQPINGGEAVIDVPINRGGKNIQLIPFDPSPTPDSDDEA